MTTPSSHAMSFELLVTAIGQTHAELAAQAARAVNTGLTARNWLIGFYIEEYERHGVDRQQYGDKLLDRLAETLERKGAFRRDRRELYRYRQFYLTYPQIVETLSPQLIVRLGASSPGPKRGIVESASPQSEISASPLRDALPSELDIPPQRLMQSLSFSHFAELILLKEPLKRRFYEVECLRGNWSVRELKRQIASLYYERSGLSSDKNKLADHVQGQAEKSSIGLSVRDPYVFEFLGLKPQEVMYETDVEDALLDNLQEFLPELGHGFCFEARQKRILIGDSHNFVDLVFYHRILKCHVLVELKVAAFSHENIGQLNTYVSWYRKHMMTEGDNPPVGILLCTQKDTPWWSTDWPASTTGSSYRNTCWSCPRRRRCSGSSRNNWRRAQRVKPTFATWRVANPNPARDRKSVV